MTAEELDNQIADCFTDLSVAKKESTILMTDIGQQYHNRYGQRLKEVIMRLDSGDVMFTSVNSYLRTRPRFVVSGIGHEIRLALSDKGDENCVVQDRVNTEEGITAKAPDKKKYKSLYSLSKTQPNSEVFGFFWFNSKEKETWETPYLKIAERAIPEKWYSDTDDESKGKTSILRNYLNQTFLRVQEEGKIAYSKDRKRAAFNTGLLNRLCTSYLYCVFKRNITTEPNKNDWKYYGVHTEYDLAGLGFDTPPAPAEYINNFADLVLDHTYEFVFNAEHIVQDNHDRLPKRLQGNEAEAIEKIYGVCNKLKYKLRQNWRLGVPTWYKHKIQLLLPLFVGEDEERPEAVLVAEKNPERKQYLIRTILTPEMAYCDARILCPPSSDWLCP